MNMDIKEKERQFIRDMKIRIINFEYETDRAEKLDILDSIIYHARNLEDEYL